MVIAGWLDSMTAPASTNRRCRGLHYRRINVQRRRAVIRWEAGAMSEYSRFVGFDVSGATIAVAVAEAGRTPNPSPATPPALPVCLICGQALKVSLATSKKGRRRRPRPGGGHRVGAGRQDPIASHRGFLGQRVPPPRYARANWPWPAPFSGAVRPGGLVGASAVLQSAHGHSSHLCANCGAPCRQDGPIHRRTGYRRGQGYSHPAAQHSVKNRNL